jgi:phosphoribosylglycinamide formyltransferase 2
MTKVLLLGSGELGKEVVIELKRYGAYVVAADRYFGAPAMQVADESVEVDMLDANVLRALVLKVQPDLIVPEIEAIATTALSHDLMQESGAKLVPSRKAVQLTMNREGIRVLASEVLDLKTSPYRFASSFEELKKAAQDIGFPVVVKPVQSSSGKGQSVAKNVADVETSWKVAQQDARGGGKGVQRCIVEGFVDFDYEITLLTCVSSAGITFCPPIGHNQVDGDYRTSWQPMAMSEKALKTAQVYAERVVQALVSDTDRSDTPVPSGSANASELRIAHDTPAQKSVRVSEPSIACDTDARESLNASELRFDSKVDLGYGIFGVEFFIKGDDVIFSEVSPRPHDTGMVTSLSQNVSEFAMHARSILGLPVFTPEVTPGASRALLAKGQGSVHVEGIAKALEVPQSEVRIFGKLSVNGERRVGVALALGQNTDEAISRVDVMERALDIRVLNNAPKSESRAKVMREVPKTPGAAKPHEVPMNVGNDEMHEVPTNAGNDKHPEANMGGDSNE